MWQNERQISAKKRLYVFFCVPVAHQTTASHMMAFNNMRTRTNFLGSTFAILIGFLLSSCNLLESSNRLNYVPNGLNVSKVLYAKEESWGFGPGGNETGIVVYELPDETVKVIEQKGISFLNALPEKRRPSNDNDWHGVFREWHATPIDDEIWTKYTSCECLRDGELKARSALKKPMLFNYLNRYGFAIPIDNDVEKEIDDSISIGDSYFAYGRIGVFIVMPKLKKAAFIYNG